MKFKNTISYAFMCIILICFIGCAEMKGILEMAGVQKPQARISGIKISQVSFKDIGLIFNIEINNPNSMGIHLDGFDYDFILNGSSFVKGDQNQGVDIESKGKSVVPFPITLTFKDIYNLSQSMKNMDEIGYKLNTGLKFDLPVLGMTRIPLETSGKIPAVKVPSIKLESLSLKKMGLTSVDLEAVMNIDNPNIFGLNLDGLNYALSISGVEWISGKKSSAIALNKKADSKVAIPISLNILNMGKSVVNMIQNGNNLDYKLSANSVVGSTLEMFGKQNIDLTKSGKIDILK
ncbi:MAG: LEA type 2 family protein [Calditrichaceae bacterium]|nr:LEA type 2 family protein [Calditrichaceae bacterium]MBN2708017.1 LEA type 2 family protein [Calditrichaceae bacterium]RQV93958.1 MAG: hypothetical protein EH224_11425 [Calditrichota bacterium]